jgi:hypothetical protein
MDSGIGALGLGLGIERGLHGWIGLSWNMLLVLRLYDSAWGSGFVELDMLELCEIGLKVDNQLTQKWNPLSRTSVFVQRFMHDTLKPTVPNFESQTY